MLPQPRILIVEDELIVALELDHRLRRQGYAIVGMARSAEEALAIVDSTRVDLALLDLRLAGDRNGIEVAGELNQRDIPFVFLTAHGDDETLARVKSVEPQGYLLKPFDERLLRLTIETSLYRHGAERARLQAERARSAAERACRAAETMQATILDHSPDGVLVLAEDGSIALSNRAARQMFELGAKPAPSIDLLVPDMGLLDWKHAGPPREVQRIEAQRSGGDYFPAEIVCGVAPLDVGDRLIVIIRDITSRSELEQQLARARQLEVAGRVASGVAHDLNNLLSVVWMSAHMLQRSSPNELPSLKSDLDNAIRLGASLTARLLSLVRREKSEASAVRLGQALDAIARLARRALKSRVELVVEVDPRVTFVWIDPAQLDQVLLNLMLNADRAMPRGGRLTIRSKLLEGQDQAFVAIEVEDTGVGIDDSIRLRLFEPFFTTHRQAGGTGLGLSIVKDVVEQVDGRIEFESELGRGTCFRVLLPRHRCQGDTEVEPSPVDAAALIGRGRVVLLVDSDESHGRSLARLFEARGFRPLLARGPGDAMLMAERGRDPIALALVDIELPYMDGHELSERLARLHPRLPVLLICGCDAPLANDRGAAGGIVSKPIEPELLFAQITRLLTDLEEPNLQWQ